MHEYSHAILLFTLYKSRVFYHFFPPDSQISILPDESESSTFTCKTISRYINISYFAASFEMTTKILGRRPKRKIIDF